MIKDVYSICGCNYNFYLWHILVWVFFPHSACGNTSTAVYQTAGLIYQRQAACAVFHWFRKNAVTCRDISLSVCLPVWFCIHPVSACLMQLALTLFYSSLLGFPNEPAADIALNTVKCWIEQNPDKVGHARAMHI